MPYSYSPATLRKAWIESAIHIHRFSTFGFVHRMYGWTTVGWDFHGRVFGVAMAEWPESDLDAAIGFLRDRPGDWFVETTEDAEVNDNRLTFDHVIPGHAIPTREDYLSQWDFAGVTLVSSQKQVDDFAMVQDAAYHEVYDFPFGLGKSFYTDHRSIIGRDLVAAILYDDDLPVRTAYAIRASGVAVGVGGAVMPSHRGRHLGEKLWPVIGAWVREEWDLQHVYHVTMPCATRIAERNKLAIISLYKRWRLNGA